MFKIQTLNKISTKGLDLLPRDSYEYASEIVNPDGIVLRSFSMHDMQLPDSLKAVARAGAGVNNIPIDKCSEKGIVVFNTPGANANAVKEMTLMGLFIASRKVFRGINWAKSLYGKGEEVPKLIEKGKSDFTGPEIKGKKLGIIGLGAIGVMVANDAEALGMEVLGYDPFVSVESAWKLSRTVKRAPNIENLLSQCDFISLHVPLNEHTKGFINKAKFEAMKKGVRLLNFARGGLVVDSDLIEAINNQTVEMYVTDFPTEELLNLESVIPIPHLGASTPESEENCAVMAVNQLRDFLENGNIVNSVNFPDCSLPRSERQRIIIANKNIPSIIGQYTAILSNKQINIGDMINKSRRDNAYNILDVDSPIDEATLAELKNINGMLMVRTV